MNRRTTLYAVLLRVDSTTFSSSPFHLTTDLDDARTRAANVDGVVACIGFTITPVTDADIEADRAAHLSGRCGCHDVNGAVLGPEATAYPTGLHGPGGPGL